MGLEGYQLRSQLGAGRDGIAFRAMAADGVTTALVLALARAKADRFGGPGWSALKLASQIAQPAALKVLELGLEQEPLGRPGMGRRTTLATTKSAGPPTTERAAAELIRDLAAALAQAHRLGSAHGRLGPDQVFLTDNGHAKLDFTGFQPAILRKQNAVGSRTLPRQTPGGGQIRAFLVGRLYGLGSLIAWLEGVNDDPPRGDLPRKSPWEPTARQAREELMADDPGKRPAAHEVLVRLGRILRPVDATGDWSEPDNRSRGEGTISSLPTIARRSRRFAKAIIRRVRVFGLPGPLSLVKSWVKEGKGLCTGHSTRPMRP